jgi:hypothetical protein
MRTGQVKIRASINKHHASNGSGQHFLQLPKQGLPAAELKDRLQSRVRTPALPRPLYSHQCPAAVLSLLPPSPQPMPLSSLALLCAYCVAMTLPLEWAPVLGTHLHGSKWLACRMQPDLAQLCAGQGGRGLQGRREPRVGHALPHGPGALRAAERGA